MDATTLDAIKEIIQLVTKPEAGFRLATLLTSIGVPIVTGGILAFLAHFLDAKRRKQIEKIEEDAKLLGQKLDRQNASYEKLLSFSSENKRQSMVKAIDLYGQMYELYWKLVDKYQDIDVEFQKVKRCFYQNALFLNIQIQNAMFVTMLSLSSAIHHDETPTYSDRMDKAHEQLQKLAAEMQSVFDLVGTKINLEDIGKHEE